MELLKEKTVGLCSECYKKVPARIIADDNQVVIEKECHEHGKTTGVLEKDVAFFKKLINAKRKEDPNPFPYRCLMINITHACNLKCNLCYLPERNTELDFSFDEIREMIDAYPGYTIALSGGEPTLREDLPEIIKYVISKKKICSVVTNGVKLTDYDYLKTLKDAGLMHLNFSFNGLKEEAFTGIENANLLDTKLKALSNVKKVGGLYTQISYTMAKGINDDQLGELFKYAMENNDFIYQIRARVATGIGRRIGEKNIYLSDFLRLLGNETNIPYEFILDYWINNDYFPNPYIFSLDFFNFLMNPEIAVKLDPKVTPQTIIPYLSRYIGEKNAIRLLNLEKREKDSAVMHPTFMFVLFSWPDKNTLDYEEIKGLNLDILTRDKKVLNYWDGIIQNEKFAIL